jgi:replicative DNA helicase
MIDGLAPPRNDEIERYVLGSCLHNSSAIAEVIRLLKPEDFYIYAHQLIYREVCALFERGITVDTVTLAEALRSKSLVEEVGGYAYLAKLLDMGRSGYKTEQYSLMLRDKAIARSVLRTSREVAGMADTCSGEELLGVATQKLLEIATKGAVTEAIPLSVAINEAFDRIDARAARGDALAGISTGYQDLDTLTAGLQDGELVIVAARPSVGKSGLALNMARRITRAGLGVLFVSLEMSSAELSDRLLCCEAQIDSGYIRCGALDSSIVDGIEDAGRRLRNFPLFIDDAAGQGMLRITATARRFVMKHRIRAVFVDYLQLVAPENKRDSRQEQVAGISRSLKRMARDLDLPVVACAQLNRALEHRGADSIPRLSDLRESGSIENDADVVILLHHHKDKDDHTKNLLTVNVAKQRNGPTGEVTLVYLRPQQRIESYARDPLIP